MKQEISELIDKFLRREISTEELRVLRQLYDSKRITEESLSAHYDERWHEAAENPAFPADESRKRVWAKLESELRKPAVRRKTLAGVGSKVAAVVAVAILSAALAFAISRITHKTLQENLVVHVENSQKARVQLPDGSSVWLNSASEISYSPNFGKKSRTVKLLGEAYFEVQSNPHNPFIVQTWNGLEIKALGTKFNVKSYRDDDQTTGTLLEGKIDVSNPTFSETLLPNERIVFNTVNNTFQKSRVQSSDEAIFWMTNQLVFDSETLENIAKILERMYNIKFAFASTELKSIRYSGKINNNSLENVMNLISTVSPLRYTIDNSVIIISKK